MYFYMEKMPHTYFYNNIYGLYAYKYLYGINVCHTELCSERRQLVYRCKINDMKASGAFKRQMLLLDTSHHLKPC